MKIIYKEKEIDLKYTFNSFIHMEEFDLNELEELSVKPFKMIKIAKTLLTGALNYDPKKIYNDVKVMDILESKIEDGELVELITELVDMLQESNFFKNLQQTKSKK